MANIYSYKDLLVWQKSIFVCEEIYRVTNKFPTHERYGLTSQLRRCCISIPSNIAEGKLRGHKTEYKQFLHIAYGSGAELETQLLLALRIGYLEENEYTKIVNLHEEVMRMLNKLIIALSPKPKT